MSGVYGPGAHLPSTRALGAELGVSRTTVTAAYEQLLAEGFLVTRQGAKTRVAEALSTISPPAKRRERRSRPVRLSTYGRRTGATISACPA
jgi:GntR family transcriptional regulator/MocR family aminotransferase